MTNQSIAAREIPLALSNLPSTHCSVTTHLDIPNPCPITQDGSLGFQALLGGPWCFFPAMVRTSPFALRKWSEGTRSDEDLEDGFPFQSRLLYQVPVVSIPKRTNMSQDTVSSSRIFLDNFGYFFGFFSQKRKAGLFCNEFSTEANWSAGQVEAPNGGEDDLDTQTAAVSHRSLTDMHQNNTIALPVWPREMRFCPHQHQQSDAWLLCTNEWKARAATTEISLPKHENCCLFHRHEVVTT